MSVNQVDKQTGNTSLVAGGTLYADAPIGAIQAFGGTSAPAGWLLCQGQAISRTTYAALFAAIGTAFGAGDGSTTFNVPDLRGEFLRGAGTNSHTGQGDGGSVGQHQDATAQSSAFGNNNSALILAHSNDVPQNTDKSSIVGITYIEGSNTAGDSRGIKYTARPTNTSVNYIIKAQQVALPLDIASKMVITDIEEFVLESKTYPTGNAVTTDITTNKIPVGLASVDVGHTPICILDAYPVDDSTFRISFRNFGGASFSASPTVKIFVK